MIIKFGYCFALLASPFLLITSPTHSASGFCSIMDQQLHEQKKENKKKNKKANLAIKIWKLFIKKQYFLYFKANFKS